MDWGVASTLLVLNICVMRISSQNDISRPPVFDRSGMLDKVFVPRGRVELECRATGQPPPRYRWLKNGETLVIETDGRLNQSEGDLRISNMESSDAGLYQCYAENEFGGALSRTYNLIEAMVKYKSNSHITYINVTEGDPLSIMIAHPYESIPKPVHIWERISNEKATQITPDKRIQIDDRGNLHFAYVTREDGSIGEGYYKHTLFNPMLDMKAGGSYTRVIVKSVSGGVKLSPPAITPSSVSSVIAVEQQNVSFRCIFSGYPEPKVTWTGPRVSALSDFETKLTIYRVQSTDEGNYVCRGENSEGSTNAEVHLKVEAAPVFRSTRDSPHDVTVTEGSDHTFNCDTYAKPEATVEWYMNGVRINAEVPPSRIQITGNKRRLKIQRVCRSCDDGRRSDSMNIQCNASNVHGYILGVGYVTVVNSTMSAAVKAVLIPVSVVVAVMMVSVFVIILMIILVRTRSKTPLIIPDLQQIDQIEMDDGPVYGNSQVDSDQHSELSFQPKVSLGEDGTEYTIVNFKRAATNVETNFSRSRSLRPMAARKLPTLNNTPDMLYASVDHTLIPPPIEPMYSNCNDYLELQN